MDSTIQQQSAKWYSALQLPTITSSTNSNRVSPLLPAKTTSDTKRTSSSPSLVVKYEQPSPTTITHLFKRFARTPSTSIKNANNSWLNLSLSKKKEEQQDVYIYMKSPHVVANGELAGTLVIMKQQEQQTIDSIKLLLTGVEAVIDSQHHATSNNTIIRQHEFLNLNILNLTSAKDEIQPYLFEASIFVIPFFMTLPSQLGTTYIDKKGSIQYYLHTQISYMEEEEHQQQKKPAYIKTAVTVYPNVASLKSSLDLYMPSITESKDVSITLSRTVWMSGAPIYVTIDIAKGNVNNNITKKMKLELLRKQNTCCLNNQKDNSIIPLTSTCEVIATSNTDLDNLKYHVKEGHHFILSIDAPANQATVSNQKLIDVSFVIRIIAYYSQESTETVLAEMPIMLVHPVAMNPPPSLASTVISDAKKDEEIIVEATGKISKEETESVPASSKITTTNASYTSSLTSSSTTNPRISSISVRHNSPLIRASTPQHSTKKPLEKMKRSFSTWGTKLSRKMSMPRVNSSQQVVKPRPEISSPILSHYSDSSSSDEEGDRESVISSLYTSPKQDLNSVMIRSSQQQRRSVMKFGQMKGPKRFGQQPGSLGDAGLDIRNCFNVAKVTEVIQSYAAEKVEILDDIAFDSSEEEEEEEDEEEGLDTPKNNSRVQYPPYLEPIQLEEQYVWKKGFIAPPEKCQLDISMLEQDTSINTKKKYSEGNKRMLASSRHLMQQQQRKNSASSQQVILPPSSV